MNGNITKAMHLYIGVTVENWFQVNDVETLKVSRFQLDRELMAWFSMKVFPKWKTFYIIHKAEIYYRKQIV